MEAAAQRVPELVVSRGGGSPRRGRAVVALACACVLVAAVCAVCGGYGGEYRAVLQMVDLKALRGAELPSYSPAALALAKSQKEVQGIVEHEAQRKLAAGKKSGKKDTDMAGGTSLTKKQLAKIVSSARAAAEKNNALIYAADGALAASQKELGKDAVKVSTLSTASDDMGSTFKSLISLAASDKSKSTQAALEAAQAAAKKNRQEMDDAANIMKESQALLGKDAISLPSLGNPKSGPSPLFKAVLNGVARTKDAARGISFSQQEAGRREEARPPASLEEDRKTFLVNREFLHATMAAHMLP